MSSLTNIGGFENILEAAVRNKVKRIVDLKLKVYNYC